MNKSELLVALPKEIKRLQKRIQHYKDVGMRAKALDIEETIRVVKGAISHSDGFALLRAYNEIIVIN